MSRTGERDIYIVGVDGSPSAYVALDWAVGHARQTDAKVRVITAWHYIPQPWSPGMTPAVTPEESETVAHRIATLAVLPYSDCDVEVTADAIEGAAWKVLVTASAEADLLVVGSRGHGVLAGALLGSVAQHCTAHALCPVVVVPQTIARHDTNVIQLERRDSPKVPLTD